MGQYKYDMSKETERSNFSLEDGWYDFEISDMKESTSKAGNTMFVVHVALAKDPNVGTDIYMVAEEGKRWFLKQLLKACDCPASEDGVYDFDLSDIVGQLVSGRVENKDETWIDRNGLERVTKKAKVVEFKKA